MRAGRAGVGVFRRGIDPSELYITIAALGFFYFSNVHTLFCGHESDPQI